MRATKRISRGLLTLLVTLSTGVACAASDWRYAGTLRLQDGGGDAPQFFDAWSIGHPTKSTTRVWVKVIRPRDLENYHKAHEPSVTHEVAHKIATGYVPDFLLLPAARSALTAQGSGRLPGGIPATLDEAVAELTRYEVIANAVDIRAVSKLWIEIDCVAKRFRNLTLSCSATVAIRRARERDPEATINSSRQTPGRTGWRCLSVHPRNGSTCVGHRTVA